MLSKVLHRVKLPRLRQKREREREKVQGSLPDMVRHSMGVEKESERSRENRDGEMIERRRYNRRG